VAALERACLWAALIALAAAAGCTAVQFSYNNAGGLVRFVVWEYVDLDGTQSQALQQRFARLQEWHRSSELPDYVRFLQSLHARAARGVTHQDADWAIESLRARYRLAAVRAAEEAAPILGTLNAEQLASIERKFAKEDAKYVKEWLSGSASRREQHSFERMLERFEEWTGELRSEQEDLIRQFVRAHPRSAELRLEDRRRWQRAALQMVREARRPDELVPRLAMLFGNPDADRPEDYVRETKRWESDLADLVVTIDRTLSAEQRARVLRRIDRYEDDFRALSRGSRVAQAPQ
jgi:hypothetical protein